MKIEVYSKDSRLFLSLNGRLILEICESLRNIVQPLIAPPVESVFLGLSKVEYLDSAGLGALVDLKVLTQKNRMRLALVGPSTNAANILAVSKLEEIFEIITGADAERITDEMMDSECKTNQFDTIVESIKQSNVSIEQNTEAETTPAQAAAGQAGQDSATAAKEEPQTDREKIEAFCREAVENLREGDLEASIKSYQQAIDLDPNYIPARNNLAIVYEKKPAWRRLAIEQWEKLLELSRQSGDEKHMERAHKHLAKLRAN